MGRSLVLVSVFILLLGMASITTAQWYACQGVTATVTACRSWR